MREIVVTFMDGSSAVYTTAVLRLLKGDPAVWKIVDRDTGEVIWAKVGGAK